MTIDITELKNNLIELSQKDVTAEELEALINNINPLYLDREEIILELKRICAQLNDNNIDNNTCKKDILELCNYIENNCYPYDKSDEELLMDLISLAYYFEELAREFNKKPSSAVMSSYHIKKSLSYIQQSKLFFRPNRKTINDALNHFLDEINQLNINDRAFDAAHTTQEWADMAIKIIELFPNYKKILGDRAHQSLGQIVRDDFARYR
jgi:hypothetical protein